MSAIRTRALAVACLFIAACAPRAPGGDGPSAMAVAGHAAVAIARGTIDVDGGVIRVAANRDGRVAALAAEEGDTVAAGQVLLRLDSRSAEQAVAIAHAEADVATTQNHAAASRRLAAAAVADRARAAESQGVGTEAAAADAAAALAQATADQQVAVAQAALADARLRGAETELAQYELRAPVAGRIVRRNVGLGEALPSAAVDGAFELVPERPLVARIEVDEDLAPRVHPGATVELRAEFDELLRWNGRVRRIADEYGKRSPGDTPGERQDQHVLICIVDFDNPPGLRIGQRVIARVLQ